MQNILTYYRLGIPNILRIIIYRLLCKSGFYSHLLPNGKAYDGPFWKWPDHIPSQDLSINKQWIIQGDSILSGKQFFYSNTWRNTGFPPVSKNQFGVHWTKIQEFSLEDDIKNIWEASRFHGFLTLALASLSSGETRFSQGMESWLTAWIKDNPTNAGSQWKCGQETGLRLMHTLLASEILHRHANVTPTKSLERFVSEHCQRIGPTMIYAIAQDNNHGTSEAAALYMAGIWLEKYFPENSRAKKWKNIGRYWLENRISKLILPDGSFSQHSVNYHRLMLDTVCMVEYWRKIFNDQKFTSSWYQKTSLATHWLATLIDPENGNAPNLGANDGARVFVLHQAPYRDFRPSVQLARALFEEVETYPDKTFQEIFSWLKLPPPTRSERLTKRPTLFSDGGYACLASSKMWGVLRLPKYKFRPNQSDALHFDLWRNGINWLRDGGTYSYNADERWLNYFPGTHSHSTIQFDHRNQMPRLGRFLFGHWLSPLSLLFKKEENYAQSAYVDYQLASHSRTVKFESDNVCIITDEVSGFKNSAILRFRLPPIEWELKDLEVISAQCSIKVSSKTNISRAEIVTGHESLHYEELSEIPVFECEVHSPTIFTTIIRFQDS